MKVTFQVKAATGEEVSAEDLGGADLHCRYNILWLVAAFRDVAGIVLAHNISKTDNKREILANSIAKCDFSPIMPISMRF